MGSFLLDALEFIILGLFLKAMFQNLGSFFGSPRTQVRRPQSGPPMAPPTATHRGEMARDPVCGMFVATELSQQLRQGTDTVHFCSRECLEKYQKDAENAASR